MESTLSLTLNDLKAEAGDYLGFGHGSLHGEEAWTANKERRITSAVQTAVRMVRDATLNTDGGVPKSHSWSWLRPYTTVPLAAGAREALLPDDWNGFEGELAVSQGTRAGIYPIRVDNAEVIRQRYAMVPNMTGRPTLAAVEPLRGGSPHRGTRFKLVVYPEPEAEYTLGFHYAILTDYPTDANPYPPGGAGMAEVYKAAARAAAELLQNDQQQGPAFAHFQACLAAAVLADKRKRPLHLGYNGDTSDGRHPGNGGRRGGAFGITTITIAGQDPG